MVIPTAVIANVLTRLIGGTELGQIAVVACAVVVGAAVYVAVQAVTGAPELAMLRRDMFRIRRAGTRGGDPA